MKPFGTFISTRYGLLIVLSLMTLYATYFSALSIQRHYAFRTYASDMGQMDQALWNTLHGNLLQDTRANGQNLPRLTDHVEPIFLVIPFAFLIYDGIETLFVLQSVAIALGALAIYWIARRRLQSEWAGGLFAAMYLLFPALQAANLAEFHAVTFAPAPLLFAYNYGEARAWKRYALFSLIALAVKEDMALLVITLAIYFAFKLKGKREKGKGISFSLGLLTFSLTPIIIAFASLAWFLIALYGIIPQFSPRGESVYIGRYPQSPFALIAGLFIPAKIAYVAQLFASVGFLALFDPLPLIIGSPALILNLLSSYPAQYSGTYHYSAPVAPYFVLAAIGGAAWLKSKVKSQKWQVASILAAFVITLGYHALAGYTPFGGAYFAPEVTPHYQTLARFTRQIPADAKVSTTSTLFSHLSHRRVLYRFPTILDAEYILLDVSQSNITNPIDYVMNYRNALANGFGIRDALDGYILLQRGLSQKELPDGFYNFIRTCHCILPQYPARVDFGDQVRLLGYDVQQDDWQRVYLRTYWERLPGLANNFALFPFYPDEAGDPRADAQLPPLMLHFWYPTARWQPDEVIVADTLPLELNAPAQIGVGVFFGADWDTAEYYLVPQTDLPVSTERRWVALGELTRAGKTWRARLPAR